ncbi:MAG: F0F1 ATP synthase subunit A [Alphaproteobacteria bacterium]|nr:F0F1 ATP synthase subunit A [Alphaproteobacteria bacterium]
MAAGGTIDALGQFTLHPALGRIGAAVHFSQSNLFMVIAGVLVLLLLWLGMRPRALVPGRLQAAAELSYETVMSMCVETIGPEGRRFFPFIFTLFFFILLGNLLGVWPYFFTFTSHIAVTLAMAVFVVVMVTVVALRLHGLHFFSYFMPKGVPIALAPLLIPIEILSYLSRIISLSVRLFANMMAGHAMLEVFGAFVVMLGGAGLLGIVPAGVSLAVNVALIGFEILVAALQAYVFAILTCIYLHDAVHLH